MRRGVYAAFAYMIAIAIYCVVRLGPFASIPIRYDLGGQPNSFAPAIIAVLIGPLVALVVWHFIKKKYVEADDATKGQLVATTLTVFAMFVAGQSVICFFASDQEFPFARIIVALCGLTLIVTSNGLSVLPINSAIGVQIKWSRKSPAIWFKVQKFSGRVGVLVGLLIILASFIISGPTVLLYVLLTLLAAFLAATVGYSFIVATRI